MTKAEIVELVLIRINGGKITGDTKIRKEDIASFLASAINYAVIRQYQINKDETGENEFPSAFIATYPNVEVEVDDDRELSYIDLPARIISLPKNYGLQSVSAMKGDSLFIQTNFTDRHNNSYFSNSFADTTLYWQEGQRVYFQNIATDKVLVRLIQDLNDVDDDAQLPIPGGLEVEVLKIMENWFMGQRATPADYVVNNNGNIA